MMHQKSAKPTASSSKGFTLTSAWRRPQAVTTLSVVAVAAFALSACGSEDGPDSEESPEDAIVDPGEDEGTTDEHAESQDDADAQDDAEESPDAASSEDEPLYEAVAAVLEEYPDGVFTEFDDEGSYYEFLIYDGETERELEVDADSLEVLHTEDDEIDDEDRQEAEAVDTEFEEVLRTAADEGGAVASDAELDTSNGAVVYEIELANGSEVSVDAGIGEIVGAGS